MAKKNSKTLSQYLTANDVGHLLDLSADVIGYHAAHGHLPVASVTPSGMRLYRRVDVFLFGLARVLRSRPSRRRGALTQKSKGRH